MWLHVQIDEDELPELIVQIDEQDLGDGMRAVTIQCDEGLLKAAGVDFAKIDTGFDVKLQWASRDGNTSTISGNVDDDIDVEAQMRAMVGDNPLVTFN